MNDDKLCRSLLAMLMTYDLLCLSSLLSGAQFGFSRVNTETNSGVNENCIVIEFIRA